MIESIKIRKESIEKERLLFNNITNLKKVNILFGGNGAGKSTLLNGLYNNTIEIEFKNEFKIMNYITNKKELGSFPDSNLADIREVIKYYNSLKFSAGQSNVHYMLSFLKDVEEKATKNEHKSIVVTIDDFDSNISIVNIELLLNFIIEIVNKNMNVQFFISTTQYHCVYIFEEVINIYTGKWEKITSYNEFIEKINQGEKEFDKKNKINLDYLNII